MLKCPLRIAVFGSVVHEDFSINFVPDLFQGFRFVFIKSGLEDYVVVLKWHCCIIYSVWLWTFGQMNRFKLANRQGKSLLRVTDDHELTMRRFEKSARNSTSHSFEGSRSGEQADTEAIASMHGVCFN